MKFNQFIADWWDKENVAQVPNPRNYPLPESIQDCEQIANCFYFQMKDSALVNFEMTSDYFYLVTIPVEEDEAERTYFVNAYTGHAVHHCPNTNINTHLKYNEIDEDPELVYFTSMDEANYILSHKKWVNQWLAYEGCYIDEEWALAPVLQEFYLPELSADQIDAQIKEYKHKVNSAYEYGQLDPVTYHQYLDLSKLDDQQKKSILENTLHIHHKATINIGEHLKHIEADTFVYYAPNGKAYAILNDTMLIRDLNPSVLQQMDVSHYRAFYWVLAQDIIEVLKKNQLSERLKDQFVEVDINKQLGCYPMELSIHLIDWDDSLPF